MRRDWFSVQAAGGGATGKKKGGGEILIYGVIGKRWYDEDAVGAKEFIKEFQALVDAGPGDIHIRINSPGGDVADGMAIYNAIRGSRARVVCTIDSVAYSMASVIALAGRTTRMQDTGQFMIHNPIVGVYGSEKELESALKSLKTAKVVLMKAYRGKTGKSEEEISGMMGATSWMSAEEAKEAGFVDEVLEEREASLSGIAACFDAQAWERWYRRQGPMPVEDVSTTDGTDSPDEEESDGSIGSDVLDLDDGGGDAPTDESGARKPPLHNGGNAPKEKKTMNIAQIKAACPGASLEFVLAQAELCESNPDRGEADVVKAFNAELVKARAEEQTQHAAALAAAQASASTKAPAGTSEESLPPLASGGGSTAGTGGDPVADYNEALDALVAKGKSRAEAIRAVAVEKPQVHAAYLRAHNGKYGRPVGRFAV